MKKFLATFMAFSLAGACAKLSTNEKDLPGGSVENIEEYCKSINKDINDCKIKTVDGKIVNQDGSEFVPKKNN